MTAAPVGRLNYGLRTVVLGGFVALLGWAAYTIHDMRATSERQLADRQRQIDALTADVASRDLHIAEQAREIETLTAQVKQLETALRLLKVDHRLARLTVLEQTGQPGDPAGSPAAPGAAGAPAADGAGTRTVVSFQELDDAGQPLGEPRTFTLAGKVAYVDALVIKFGDSFVEQGDALRGSSICLFRRLFGEFQKPAEGFPLDSAGARPLPYAGNDADPGFESNLWKRFWDYANDPAAASAAGVRAMHGEAPYIELRSGQSYLVELRASGGLSLRPE